MAHPREISEDGKPGKHAGKYCSRMWKSPPFSPPEHKGIPGSDTPASPPVLVSRNLGETSSQPPNPHLCLLCIKQPEPWDCLPNTSQNCWVLSREHWGWGPRPAHTGEHVVSYGKMQRGSPSQLPEQNGKEGGVKVTCPNSKAGLSVPSKPSLWVTGSCILIMIMFCLINTILRNRQIVGKEDLVKIKQQFCIDVNFWLQYLFFYVLFSCRNSLHFLDVNPLLDMWFTNICSHSVDCSFTLLTCPLIYKCFLFVSL